MAKKQMRRIEAILKGKMEDDMRLNKIRLFENMLENAALSFKDDILETSLSLDDEIGRLGETSGKGNVKEIIRRMSEIMDKKADAEEGLKRIEEIEEYVNGFVDVDETEE